MVKICPICSKRDRDFLNEIKVDEVIDNYYKCLDDDDREWTIKEEDYYRDIFNLDIMLDNTLEKLKNNKLSKSHIQGIHTYDILRNPAYIDAF